MVKRTKDLKQNYKDAIYITLENIRNNVDDIVDIAFKNSTRNIDIDIQIEPDDIVKWALKMNINSSTGDEYVVIKGENFDEKKNKRK